MELLREITKLGLDVGALTAMIIVIIKLLDINKSTMAMVNENTKVTTLLKESIDANTKVTHEMADHFRAKKCLSTP